MRVHIVTIAAICAASLGLSVCVIGAPAGSPSPGISPNFSPSPESTPLADLTNYNGFLLSTKIVGSQVENKRKEKIGDIDDLVVNPDTGRVRFAVLDVGKYLGGNDSKIVVPWGAIGLEKNAPGSAPSYIVDVDKDRLEKAPKFDPNKLADLYKRAGAQPIFDYYDIIYFDDIPAPAPAKGNHEKGKPAATPSASPSR